MNEINLPKQFESRMKDMLKDEYEAFKNELSGNEYTGIRINTLKDGSLDAVLSVCGEIEPVLWCKNGYYADKDIISGKHPYHVGGLLYFQEPSAMLPVEALDIQKGDFVLDLCAAPGGKSTQAAEKLCGSGILVANEIVEKRAKILAENIMRFGIKNAFVTNEAPNRLSAKYPEFFDKIIVDAPCSGEGMFRKNINAIAEWSEEHTRSCAMRQKKILADAFYMLKRGGDLVYSTCTFAPCENEGVVDWVLRNYDDIELKPIKAEGLCDANGNWVDSGFDISGAKRIFPHRSKGEGHFIALFHKKGNREKQQCKENKKSCDNSFFSEFQSEYLNTDFKNNIVPFGERLYLLPEGIDTDGIKLLLCGLFLGIAKKDRFEPSHALCLALSKDDFRNTQELSDPYGYFSGETFMSDKNGWTALLYNRFPMGWGKASGGIMKNHFPKYLRF